MSNSTTPELDKWQDLHTRACAAEHQIMMRALGFTSAGSPPPKTHEIEQAKMLRAMANVQFDKAMTEVLGLSNRLGARLMPKQFGNRGSTGAES